MNVICKKPRKFCLKSSEVLWILDHRITDGRLRQVARAFNLGWSEPDSITMDGSEPKKTVRWFQKSDIPKIIDACKSLKKAVQNGELEFSEKLQKVA